MLMEVSKKLMDAVMMIIMVMDMGVVMDMRKTFLHRHHVETFIKLIQILKKSTNRCK
jgi:hypothetical protein